MECEDKYNEALKKASIACKKDEDNRALLEQIFPELKESEDERIRKSLIMLLRHFCNGYRVSGLNFSVSFKDMLAWVEKQDRKARQEEPQGKSALEAINEEKVDNDINIKTESKFKVGDWIIDLQDITHQIANVIENVTNHTYGYDVVGGGYFNDSARGVRLWNISRDAKDGDVLANDDTILLFKVYTPFCRFASYCLYIEKSDDFHTEGLTDLPWGNYHPATEEQHKLLFRKIYENGYFWDSRNMRLIKRNY